ncbi:MAG: DUF4410 domain-containing protein, partial [Deltaproteobacteria bacterium]
MKKQRYTRYVGAVGVVVALLMAGFLMAGEVSAQGAMISFKDYPDNTFPVKEYIQGMKKGGHNLLIWMDPSVNLSMYSSVNVMDFGDRLLPQQDVFDYGPYINVFNSTFKGSLKLSQEESPDALVVEGAVVECNPGSRAARYWVGFGAGKAAGGVVCEVYEPGASQPCIRIYTRDTASSGSFGGNSVAVLNHIFSQLAIRLAAKLDTTIGQ